MLARQKKARPWRNVFPAFLKTLKSRPEQRLGEHSALWTGRA